MNVQKANITLINNNTDTNNDNNNDINDFNDFNDFNDLNDIDFNEFDEIIMQKTKKEKIKIKIHDTAKRLLEVCHNNNQKEFDTNVNDRALEPPIGDNFLENIIQIGEPTHVIDSTEASHLLRYKRDYIIIDINNDVNNITQYCVFAVSYGADTRVINLIRKKYMDLPIISYYKTNVNPSDIVEQTYQYETGKARSVFLKKNIQYINNPTKQYFININLNDTPRPDLLFNGTFLANVPSELINLAIIVKNKQYISSATYLDLVQTVDYLTIF